MNLPLKAPPPVVPGPGPDHPFERGRPGLPQQLPPELPSPPPQRQGAKQHFSHKEERVSQEILVISWEEPSGGHPDSWFQVWNQLRVQGGPERRIIRTVSVS